MDIHEWYEQVTGKDSINAVATKAGIAPATFYKQVRKTITPTSAVRIARAYGRPPTEPLVVMELLTQEDVDALASAGSLSKASNADLIEELARRLKETTRKENR